MMKAGQLWTLKKCDLIAIFDVVTETSALYLRLQLVEEAFRVMVNKWIEVDDVEWAENAQSILVPLEGKIVTKSIMMLAGIDEEHLEMPV